MEKITLGHGSGGKLTGQLIRKLFLEHFANTVLNKLEDSAVLELKSRRIAMTTDSYVVNPIFFKGGDIGRLAVCGTINDLAVCGARPAHITAGFILEEGFALGELERVIESMAEAAKTAGARIVAGDTKVVPKGSADKIFINTAGIGYMIENANLSVKNIKPGDKIILNGSIGGHSIAILSARGELGIESSVASDCAALNGLTEKILKASGKVRFMRDVTRGGLAGVLNEIVLPQFGIELDEANIPVCGGTRAACELLGLDPLYLANEGKVLVVVAEEDAKKALEAVKSAPVGRKAAVIGRITNKMPGRVFMNTRIGGARIIDMPISDQIPRIC